MSRLRQVPCAGLTIYLRPTSKRSLGPFFFPSFFTPQSHGCVCCSWFSSYWCVSLAIQSQTQGILIYPSFLTGANREVKKAVEAYWAGTITADQLTQVAADVKKSNWTSLKDRGVDYIPRLFHLSSRSGARSNQSTLVASFLSMIMSSIIRPLSTSFPSVMLGRVCRLSTFISPWAVGVKLMASTSPPVR